MNPIPEVLQTELYRVARAMEEHALPLIIGGGYGLLLWQRRVQEKDLSTLRPVPQARSTDDLDIFLTVEVMSDPENTKTIRSILDDLAYDIVKGRENYQFKRPVQHRGQERSVKIDLLAPVPRTAEEAENIRVKERRLRPKGFSGLHAHPTPEALTIEENLLQVDLEPETAETEEQTDRKQREEVSVFVPHLFSFAMLKLFAYRDRREDPNVDYGRHHAYDLYRSVAMMTEEDWVAARQIQEAYDEEDLMEEARHIAEGHFGSADERGCLRILEYLREGPSETGREEIEAFSRDLRELFGQ